MKDSFPLSDEDLQKAADAVDDNYRGLAVLLTDPARAIPLLKEKKGLPSAHVLALMGDASRAEEIVRVVDDSTWDQGWNFRGMHLFGRSVSWVDSYLISLGRARATGAVASLRRKAAELNATDAFSHFCILALVLGRNKIKLGNSGNLAAS